MADLDTVAVFFCSEDALAVIGDLVVVEGVDVALQADELAVPARNFPDAELVAGPEDDLLLLEALEVGLRALQH